VVVGGLDPDAVADPSRVAEIAARVARRLDRVSDEVERGWRAEPDGQGGLVFSRTVRGVTERHEFDAGLLASADARKLRQMIEPLAETFRGVASLVRKDATSEIFGPASLFDTIAAAGRKGVTLQRYKGLGEMNASQLWETTLDPNVRTLLKVEIKESDDHDRLFSELMGDLVEPRRDFIQDNALSVANLDV
jgi:DNA gyrase subunit B